MAPSRRLLFVVLACIIAFTAGEFSNNGEPYRTRSSAVGSKLASLVFEKASLRAAQLPLKNARRATIRNDKYGQLRIRAAGSPATTAFLSAPTRMSASAPTQDTFDALTTTDDLTVGGFASPVFFADGKAPQGTPSPDLEEGHVIGTSTPAAKLPGGDGLTTIPAVLPTMDDTTATRAPTAGASSAALETTQAKTPLAESESTEGSAMADGDITPSDGTSIPTSVPVTEDLIADTAAISTSDAAPALVSATLNSPLGAGDSTGGDHGEVAADSTSASSEAVSDDSGVGIDPVAGTNLPDTDDMKGAPVASPSTSLSNEPEHTEATLPADVTTEDDPTEATPTTDATTEDDHVEPAPTPNTATEEGQAEATSKANTAGAGPAEISLTAETSSGDHHAEPTTTSESNSKTSIPESTVIAEDTAIDQLGSTPLKEAEVVESPSVVSSTDGGESKQKLAATASADDTAVEASPLPSAVVEGTNPGSVTSVSAGKGESEAGTHRKEPKGSRDIDQEATPDFPGEGNKAESDTVQSSSFEDVASSVDVHKEDSAASSPQVSTTFETSSEGDNVKEQAFSTPDADPEEIEFSSEGTLADTGPTGDAASITNASNLIPKSPGRPPGSEDGITPEDGDAQFPPVASENLSSADVVDAALGDGPNSSDSPTSDVRSNSDVPPSPVPDRTNQQGLSGVEIIGGGLNFDENTFSPELVFQSDFDGDADDGGFFNDFGVASFPPGSFVANENPRGPSQESSSVPQVQATAEANDESKLEAGPTADPVLNGQLLIPFSPPPIDFSELDLFPDADEASAEFPEPSAEYPEASWEYVEASEEFMEASEQPNASDEPSSTGEAEDVSIVFLVNHPVQFEPEVLAEEIAFILDEFIAQDAWVVKSVLPLSSLSMFASIGRDTRQSPNSTTFELTMGAECPLAETCDEAMDGLRSFVRDQSMDKALAARDYSQVFVYIKGDEMIDRTSGPSKASSSGLSSAVIAGIAVGGVACVSLLALGVIFLARRGSGAAGEIDAERGMGAESVYDGGSTIIDQSQDPNGDGSFLISNFGGSPRNTSEMIPWMNTSDKRILGGADELHENSFISIDTVGSEEMTINNMSNFRFEETTSSSSSASEAGNVERDNTVSRA